jgi:histidinol-phosphate/aromatic aminotransferase/cobyric acid decarboxylase-like protein
LVTGNLDLLAFLSKRFSATSISGWLQQIGLELSHQEPTVQREELAILRQEFLPQLQSNSHLKIVHGNAPYHLFQVTSELLASLKEQCSAKNLTLRWSEHYSGFADNHLRISLQHREGLRRFLSVLNQLEC